jgi:hypothetical protein
MKQLQDTKHEAIPRDASSERVSRHEDERFYHWGRLELGERDAIAGELCCSSRIALSELMRHPWMYPLGITTDPQQLLD